MGIEGSSTGKAQGQDWCLGMDFPALGSIGKSTENGKGGDRSLPASVGAWSKHGDIIPTHSKWWETDQQKQPQMGMLMGLREVRSCPPVSHGSPYGGQELGGEGWDKGMVQGLLSWRKIP